jgi:deoxyribonuclease-4
MINFGPSGLGSINESIKNLETYKKLGLKACEIPFTYGVYIKEKEDAIKIGNSAKKFGIELSIHAPYWINLNSQDKEKLKKSKERILNCCMVGTWLGASRVVFHPGYYTKDKIKDFEFIKSQIISLMDEVKKNNYKTKLAPEIMGKINVFGSVEEIDGLVKETKCDFCIDFAHILARYKKYMFQEIFERFKDKKELHIHFSGIVYGEKGEKHHKLTPEKDLRELINSLPKNKKITIINESPSPIEDSVKALKIYNKLLVSNI